MNPRELASKICEDRLAFLQALPTWGTFGKGWGRRVAEVEKTAFNMVG
jgi:lysozyme family protein